MLLFSQRASFQQHQYFDQTWWMFIYLCWQERGRIATASLAPFAHKDSPNWLTSISFTWSSYLKGWSALCCFGWKQRTLKPLRNELEWFFFSLTPSLSVSLFLPLSIFLFLSASISIFNVFFSPFLSFSLFLDSFFLKSICSLSSLLDSFIPFCLFPN